MTDSEVRLGQHSALSGPASFYSAITKVEDAYFKQVNDAGGINGRKIKFLFEDDGYTPNRSVEVVKKLVEQDQIFALFQGIGTAAHSAVSDYLLDKGVPDMFIGSGAAKWNYPLGPSTKKTIFGFNPDYITDAKILTKYALATFAGKKMALLYQNDDFGKDYLAGVKEALQKASAPGLVAEEAVDVAAVDVSAQVLKMRSAGAELLFLGLTPSPNAKVINAKAGLNYTPQLVMSYVSNDPTLFQTSKPEDVEGLISSSYLPLYNDQSAPGIPAHYDLLKKYAPDQQPNNFTVYGQAAAELMVDVLKRAGKNLTHQSLIQAAESTKGFKLSFGPEVTITPEDHRTFKALRLTKATNGQLQFISDYQTAD